MRYLIRLKYNGSEFNGWQIQPNAYSVQETLEQKIGMLLDHDVKVIGCGRADTGVHANDFYAHFESEKEIGNFENLKYKLNSVVPNSIAVKELRRVSYEFHARISAISRQYKYYITLSKNPFNSNVWWVRQPLDIKEMVRAGTYILDYKDFTSFSKLHTDVKTNLCDVTQVDLTKSGDDVVLTINANRFLRNMVRAIVGTLVEIGLGKRSSEDMKRIIEAKDRGEAGASAPAQGLFLNEIIYPEELIRGV